MGVVSDLFGGGGDDAADASIEAANIYAEYQREALDYLKEREALPQAYREAALTGLGSEYGLTLDEEGNIISDGQSLSERAKSSDYYQALLGGREAGEEAILRNASATGGLRSGNASAALAEYNADLENQAFISAYNQQLQGLTGLSGLPSLATSIAQGTAGIGQTLSQGEIAAAQAKQAGSQQGIGNMAGLAQLGLQAYSTFSDRRLKKGIVPVGERNGHKWYTWTWNEKAGELFGLRGNSEGVIADEIEKYLPDAVIKHSSGYKTVDMGMILGG
jgi:hypothetical protein